MLPIVVSDGSRNNLLFQQPRYTFRCTGVSSIGQTHFGDAVDFFGNGSGTAFISEITATPIDRVLEHSVASEPFAVVVKNGATALRWLEMGNFSEFPIFRFFLGLNCVRYRANGKNKQK